MASLIIFLPDFAHFDVAGVLKVIKDIPGVKDLRHGDLVGSLFECLYSNPSANDEHRAIVRMEGDAKAITLSGPHIHTFGFAFALQSRLQFPLRLCNSSYEFDIQVPGYSSAGELEAAALG